jgi:hypothetical protein
MPHVDFDLAAALPLLTPKAVEWAEQCALVVSESGEPLTEHYLKLAQRVGVAHPESIRLACVTQIPMPTDPLLLQAILQTGLLGPGAIGLTLHYGIYIRSGHDSIPLLSHEFRHVYQYEQAGSIAAYLPEYLQQIVQFGYANTPFEIDARDHEIPSAQQPASTSDKPSNRLQRTAFPTC